MSTTATEFYENWTAGMVKMKGAAPDIGRGFGAMFGALMKDGALSARDKELILAKAQESVAVMRGLWDTKQTSARQTVLDAGVQANQADKEAFRRAVEPMRRRYLENDAIARVVRRIEAQA